jgi:hypothetical protein
MEPQQVLLSKALPVQRVLPHLARQEQPAPCLVLATGSLALRLRQEPTFRPDDAPNKPNRLSTQRK